MLTISARKFFMVRFPRLLAMLMTIVIIAIVLLGRYFWYPVIDIRFHDTYYMVWWYYSLLPLFLLLFFVILMVKGSSRGYRHGLANLTMIVIGMAMSVLLYAFTRTNFFYGLTFYPALDFLEEISSETKIVLWRTLLYLFPSLQIILIVAILYIAGRWILARNR